jgi:hypothetical protein
MKDLGNLLRELFVRISWKNYHIFSKLLSKKYLNYSVSSKEISFLLWNFSFNFFFSFWLIISFYSVVNHSGDLLASRKAPRRPILLDVKNLVKVLNIYIINYLFIWYIFYWYIFWIFGWNWNLFLRIRYLGLWLEGRWVKLFRWEQ